MYTAAPYVIASVMVSDPAKVMIDLGIGASDQKIIENGEIDRRTQLA
jgi:hypothetical protein